MNVKVIRIDGTEEKHVVDGRDLSAIRKLVGCDCFDSVNLPDGYVMLVDDTGLLDGKAVNPKATQLYWGVCKPGTTHPICGDVAIVKDAE